MLFLDYTNVRDKIERDKNGCLSYSVGNQVDVVVMKKYHCNRFMQLNCECQSDKFMIKYRPNNKLRFTEACVEADSPSVSIAKTFLIGKHGEFGASAGVLFVSEFYDNSQIISYIPRLEGIILDRIRLVAVGSKDGRLIAAVYVPSIKGVAVNDMSVVTMKDIDTSGMKKLSVEDWFDKARVMEKC